MHLGKFRLTIIVIVFIATITILFGGKSIYYEYHIEKPIQSVYKNMPEIKGVKLQTNNDDVNLFIQINKTKNLQETFQEIKTKAEKIFGTKPFKININDKSDGTLDKTFYFIQFDIYEAIDRGDYSTMVDKIESKSKNAGVTSKLYIDDDYLYLQMEHGGNYLYKIFPRHLIGQTSDQLKADKGGSTQNG